MIPRRAAAPTPEEIAAYLESIGASPCNDLIRMGAPAYQPRSGDTPQTILADHIRTRGRPPVYYAIYRNLILMEAIA